MSKIDDAIARITKECDRKDYLIPFKKYLIEICTNDEVAEKILNSEKSLEEGFFKLQETAAERMVKQDKIGTSCMISDEAFQIIRAYYGIELSEIKPAIIDVLDLL